jgi:hypothetical protein
MWQFKPQSTIPLTETRLWVHTHCESALMADMYSIMGGVMQANHQALTTRAYPVDAIAFLARRIADKGVNTLIGFENIKNAISDKTTAYTSHDEDTKSRAFPIPPQKLETLIQSFNRFRKKESDMKISTPMGTTQPMPQELREWLETMHSELYNDTMVYGKWEQGEAKKYRMLIRNFILNCDPLQTTVKESTRLSSQQRKSPTQSSTGNRIFVWDNDGSAEPLLVFRGRMHEMFTNGVFLSSYMRTSALLDHGIPAVMSLLYSCPHGHPKNICSGKSHIDLKIDNTSATYTSNIINFGIDSTTQDEKHSASSCMGFMSRDMVQWIFQGVSINTTYRFSTLNLHQLRDRLIQINAEWKSHFEQITPPFKYPGLWLTTPPNADDYVWKLVQPHERINGQEIIIKVAPPRETKTSYRTHDASVHTIIDNRFKADDFLAIASPLDYGGRGGGPGQDQHRTTTERAALHHSAPQLTDALDTRPVASSQQHQATISHVPLPQPHTDQTHVSDSHSAQPQPENTYVTIFGEEGAEYAFRSDLMRDVVA